MFSDREIRREAEIAFSTSLVCAAPNKWMPILVAEPHIMQQKKGWLDEKGTNNRSLMQVVVPIHTQL